MNVDRVVFGATRFHVVDEPLMAALLADDKLVEALVWEATHWGNWEGRRRDEAVARLGEHGLECETYRRTKKGRCLSDYVWKVRSWHDRGDRSLVIPICSMVQYGKPYRLEHALQLGMKWSLECAKKAGVYVAEDPRPPLARVCWKGSRRAYMHTLECETCLNEGIAHCEIFPRIAKLEIESDLDPRLDPDHAKEHQNA